jgi:hypothetical protein
LDLLKEKSPEQRRRLEEMHSLMAFFEQELPALIDRWRREREAERRL